MHAFYYSYNNVLIFNIHKLLHVLASGSAQLYKTVGPYYHIQYVEMSEIHHCVVYKMDMCTEKYKTFHL
jgi:hypothetical protein